MATAATRGKIIDAALALFGESGYQAVGVDAIQRAAGVSKRTIYETFGNKDALIAEVLRFYGEDFRGRFERRVAAIGESPMDRLLGIFDVAEHWFADGVFHGCLFINAMAEFGEPESALRQVCQAYKRENRAFITMLCSDAGAPNPEALGEELAILFEGAIATAQVTQDPEAARIAKRCAAVLVAHAIQPAPTD